MDLTRIFVSFGAGLLSFFSPCVLPLIPAYICFITGMSAEELTSGKGTVKSVLPNTLLFILGFSTVFVIFGASATFLGTLFFEKQAIIKIIGGIIVIVFGLHISGLLNIKFLQLEKKLHIKNRPINMFGSFFVGMAFGFGWTPCVGPILGSILILASTGKTIGQGILLLSVYSLGLALPFLIVAIGINWALKIFTKIKKYFKTISFISGILLIIVGIWIIFG